ncbi:23S rRNA (uracil(1939)-C(5))-methyltransferase RlmD [Candidatus Geothermarchaeota archaeon ex4572_27]|nr:MAG: 23S rRNA (uracil(1939)-C(5))-methyltransferase RlmD [Candidatus Geothermarchaeota archaeon ex4572_27]
MEKVRLTIERLDEKGRGVATYRGKPVYVTYALPGDEVEAEIVYYNRRRGEYIARLREVVSGGEGRVKPRCRHFGQCGGCMFQNWDYQMQLRFKRWVVEQALRRWGVDGVVADVVPSPTIWYYRNRMDYAISHDGKVGLKEYGSWSRIHDLSECYLLSPEAVEVIAATREFMRRRGVPGWDLVRHEGFLRYVVIREGKFTGDRLVNIVTYQGQFRYLDELVSELSSRGRATGVIWGINPTITDVSVARDLRPIWGKDHLTEKVRSITFHVHPNAFFQTNSYMVPRLVEEVVKGAEGGRRAADLYSGVGLFSVFLSEAFDEVVGVEAEEAAVYSANITLEWNGISNVRYVAGRVEEAAAMVGEADTVVIDPPRPGMSTKAIRAVKSISPKRIVYVSCNPDSMMRDISMFKGYRLAGPVQPLDMFPHTPHVELVAVLEKSR